MNWQRSREFVPNKVRDKESLALNIDPRNQCFCLRQNDVRDKGNWSSESPLHSVTMRIGVYMYITSLLTANYKMARNSVVSYVFLRS